MSKKKYATNLLDYSSKEGQHLINDNSKRLGLCNIVEDIIEATGLLVSFKPIKTANGLKRYTVINVCSNGKLISDHLNITLDGSDNIYDNNEPQWNIDENEMTHLVKLKGVVKPYAKNLNKFNICLTEKPIFMNDRFERDDYGYMCVPPEKKWNILRRLSMLTDREKLMVIDKLQNEINGLSYPYFPANFIFIYALNTLTIQTQTMKIEASADNTWLYIFNETIKTQMIHLLCIIFGYLNNSPILDIYELFKISSLTCFYQQGFRGKITRCEKFKLFCKDFNIESDNGIKSKITLLEHIAKNFNISDIQNDIDRYSEHFDYLGVIDYILDELERDRVMTSTRYHM